MSLEVQNISIDRGGKRIVSNVSLTVQPGEVVAIAGPNGSGKSTILGAMSGELPYVEGEIKIEGKPINEWHPQALARQRAVLLQESPLTFPFTVIDVILMGRSPHHQGLETERDIHIADQALMMVGLSGFESRRYTQLSGGEKQRVHLARVLSQVWTDDHDDMRDSGTAKYLILDEPTSSQDLAAQHLVLSSAQTFAKQGVGVLCVLHDLNQAAQYADRILLLSEGECVSIGQPKETLTPSLLEKVYGVPIHVLNHDDYPHPIVLSKPVQNKGTLK